MAINPVGSPGTIATATSTSVTPTFPQATTAGNFLLAWAIGDGQTTVAINDGTWSAGPHQNSIGRCVTGFYKFNCNAGETAPTFSQSDGSHVQAQLWEFSGVGSLDKTNTAAISGSPAVVAALAPDGSTSNLATVGYAWACSKSATATFTTTMTPTGFTAVGANDTGATKAAMWINAGIWVFAGVGGSVADSCSAACTQSTGTVSASAGIMTFKPAVPYAPPVRRAMQAVNRAATFFSGLDDKLPWRKRSSGGLFIPDLVTV